MLEVDPSLSLAELEPDNWPRVRWGQSGYGDPLVERCYAAAKIPLRDLDNGGIRLLIGQQCDLPYLVPLALERLKVDPLLEGTHYEGDLFCAVWRVDPAFWVSEPSLWTSVRTLSDEFWRQSKLRPEAVEYLVDKHKEDYTVFLASRPPSVELGGAF
jgi:hypothetical protein